MTPNIYYCWFGQQDKPQHLQQCLLTWQQHMPEAKIIEINEMNFDINYCQYTQQAYQQGKYAFVSDVARLVFLYQQGGIYLDTDVLMTKSLTTLLANQQLQLSLEWYDDELTGVNTGTIISSAKDPIIKKILDSYQHDEFKDEGLYTQTINQRFNQYLLQDAIEDKLYASPQVIIYPSSYFCRDINEHNYTIHDYQTTWRQQRSGWLLYRHRLGKMIKKIIGPQLFHRIWCRK